MSKIAKKKTGWHEVKSLASFRKRAATLNGTPAKVLWPKGATEGDGADNLYWREGIIECDGSSGSIAFIVFPSGARVELPRSGFMALYS